MELRSGYKQTEVGVIPKDWHVRTIGSLAKLINGRGFKPFEWAEQGLPIIRIQNLNGSETFNFYKGTYDPKIVVNPGQLLFAWSGSRGTSFGPHVWLGATGLLNYHTWKIQPNDGLIESKYLFYALKALTTFIEGEAHGAAALVHVQKWQMEAFDIPVPPQQEEQRRITEALSDADALIASLEQLLAKKRQVKQGAMQELLTGKKRLPGFTGKWETKRLGDVADIDPENLGSETSPTFSFNYISLEDVDTGTLRDYSEEVFHSAPSRARRKLRKDDVLVSTVRPNLHSHFLFPFEDGNWICSTGFCVIRCRSDLTEPRYVYFNMFSEGVTRQIEALPRTEGHAGSHDTRRSNRVKWSRETKFALQSGLTYLWAKMS